MLTIFLRHDQQQNLEQLQTRLDDADWWHGFPPDSCEIVSWVVAMGVGQIVTLRLPAHRLASVNVELERRAWGSFTTDVHPTYDFLPVRARLTRESDDRRTVVESSNLPAEPTHQDA
ncbi:hypothetical protein DK926_13055 [Rhodococcus sp. Eu-32]|uniref:hypothetical protein n=1 Tax=Rhodococcus sp. Eu-32 TaxID=1017319 RepID=UPI000DF25A0F|nr:hypothetical protein [Rhodococcus sp. Eu-32]RRQ27522.1 hypothetical protein DK926_13055 [Rhodococcus sp. Eu-32]